MGMATPSPMELAVLAVGVTGGPSNEALGPVGVDGGAVLPDAWDTELGAFVGVWRLNCLRDVRSAVLGVIG